MWPPSSGANFAPSLAGLVPRHLEVPLRCLLSGTLTILPRLASETVVFMLASPRGMKMAAVPMHELDDRLGLSLLLTLANALERGFFGDFIDAQLFKATRGIQVSIACPRPRL